MEDLITGIAEQQFDAQILEQDGRVYRVRSGCAVGRWSDDDYPGGPPKILDKYVSQKRLMSFESLKV